jgi:prepilin-type N-terminal cleavage/methylation domain-containing protein
MMFSAQSRRGFTLIELLVVVAIIAILAAIATVNFQQAQVRSKVARVDSDMRTIATAVESYFVDHNVYPLAAIDDAVLPRPLTVLTTPVAYLSSIPVDIFSPAPVNFHSGVIMTGFQYKDRASTDIGLPGETYGPYWNEIPGKKYFILSPGPNIIWDVAPFEYYDPTNGTVSVGDQIRFGPM